jgi:hypothetical protein
VQFAYVSFQQLINDKTLMASRSGYKVMINHSSDPTLNHHEVLMTLKEKNIKNTIYLPLAYGNIEYAKDVTSIAKSLFGKQVQIQDEFIDKHAYTEQFLDIGFAIFNNKVQQGLGNLIPLLWLGVKVFLREKNSVYLDLKQWGMFIYTIENDLKNEEFVESLNSAQVAHNRAVLRERLSDEVVDKYYLDCLTLPVKIKTASPLSNN